MAKMQIILSKSFSVYLFENFKDFLIILSRSVKKLHTIFKVSTNSSPCPHHVLKARGSERSMILAVVLGLRKQAKWHHFACTWSLMWNNELGQKSFVPAHPMLTSMVIKKKRKRLLSHFFHCRTFLYLQTRLHKKN